MAIGRTCGRRAGQAVSARCVARRYAGGMADASDSRPGALSDLRVVEFAQALAVPYCGNLMSDMGANVVKVEPPRGDTYRLQNRTPTKHEGRDFAICNRAKRSLCLDLTHAESACVVEKLVANADVALVSLKASDVPRYGLDYETLNAYSPDLVYLENTPYGPAGPLGQDGGYDVVAMGLSGLSAVVASEERGAPRFVRPAFADVVTGMVSALGVVTAIRHRDRTGEGQRVQTSLFHTALGMISNMVHRFEDLDGAHMDAFEETLRNLRSEGAGFGEQQAAYRDHFGGWPEGNIYFRHYRTRDGFISVGCLSPRLNERFREATGLFDPRGSKEFDAGSAGGTRILELLTIEAEALFAGEDTEVWLDRLHDKGVPAARLNFPHEIFDDPQANANGYIAKLDHPVHGEIRLVTSPLKMDKTPVEPRGASPALGAHTDEVLAEVGFDTETVAQLRSSGIVGRYDE